MALIELSPFPFQLPEEVLGMIIKKCDTHTIFSLKKTCSLCNRMSDMYMNDEVATRRVFNSPNLYRKIQIQHIKECPSVAETALTFIPELIEDSTTPISIKQNEQMIQTAFVASRILGQTDLARRLQRHNPCTHELAIELGMMPSPFYFLSNPLPFEESKLLKTFPFVLQTVTECAVELKYTTIRFQSNKDLVLRAIRDSARVLAFTPDALKDDPDFMLEVIQKNGDAYEFASDRLKDNEAFVLSICKLDGWLALYYASPRIQDSEEIVSIAIQQNPNARAFASLRIQKKFSPQATRCLIQ